MGCGFVPTTVMTRAPGAPALVIGWGTVRIIRPSSSVTAPEDRRMTRRIDLRDALRVPPGKRFRLERLDPAATHGWTKEAAAPELERQLARLADLQDRFWAEARRSVLIVLQGIDAAGKDGTINKVMEAFNPQGCPVTAFKVPTSEELAHDYLWRIHKATPRKGEIGIFNRSHYEDFLVVRVHDIVPKAVWSKRYDQINEFERLLTASGTMVIKLFLSIDRDEQR